MFGNRDSCRSAILWCALVLILAIPVLFISESVFADPGFPLRRMPICGDQDGSEVPLTFNCVEFVHVPDVQTYKVPGSGTFTFKADFIYREATYNNELGFYAVEDNAGTVDGLKPGDPGYVSTALSSAQIIFPSGSNAYVADFSTELLGGQILVFFIVQNNTLVNLIANNPNNEPNKSPKAYFSIDSLNPDGQDHFVGFNKADGSQIQFGFEDLTGGGDRDYDDVVYNIDSPVQPLPEAGLLSLPFVPNYNSNNKLNHVRSFFDHEYPLYEREPRDSRGSIMMFTGEKLNGTVDSCVGTGLMCYSGHDGTDFSIGLDEKTPVLAAADGAVTAGNEKCGGNYVRINHGDYQTLYFHLQDDSYWSHWVNNPGQVLAGDRIGTVGNSGSPACVKGVHLHFVVYYDENNNNMYDFPDELVDPFGWRDQCTNAATDPWTIPFEDASQVEHTGTASKWLWDFSQPSCVTIAANAAYSFSTPDGVLVTVPQGAINTQATLSISAAPEPSLDTTHSGKIQNGLSGTVAVIGAFQFNGLNADGSLLTDFSQPVNISIPYEETNLEYADENTLTVYQLDDATGNWNLIPTQIDTNMNRVALMVNKPGILSLRARPLYPSPMITSITPTRAINAAEATVTIQGKNFLDASSVNLGEGGLQVEFISSTELIVTVPPLMAAGTYDLILYNPDGQLIVLPDAFKVISILYLPWVMR